MTPKPVIAVFDIGKTNKKLFLFDEDYKVVFEKSAYLAETIDQDDFPCENLENLRMYIFDSLNEIAKLDEFQIKAINFSAYGASFVLVDAKGQAIAPLYNYLKPYPEELSDKLYKSYNGQTRFAAQTASPALGSLNSGLQLYRLKNEKPELFKRIKYALHLPQYLSSLLTGQFYSDITSIGCHTALWDFEKNGYHQWIELEGILPKLAEIKSPDTVFQSRKSEYLAGIGLHDSSAALIPYLKSFDEPFVLISTGTWSISMNPFNHSPLTASELKNDCLCYLSYSGKAVKSSRLFAGHEHDEEVKRIAEHFNVDISYFKNLNFSEEFVNDTGYDLPKHQTAAEAYHHFMQQLMQKQAASTNLILTTHVASIFVDGGFSHNEIFMHLLSTTYSQIKVYAASMAQASALGAAMAIHKHWNSKSLPENIIRLKHYPIV
jgi:sugar (pentulose or hexulose) kinase